MAIRQIDRQPKRLSYKMEDTGRQTRGSVPDPTLRGAQLPDLHGSLCSANRQRFVKHGHARSHAQDTKPDHYFIIPARQISEGAAPCPNLKKKKNYLIFFFFFTKCNCCFCVFRQGCKNACKMLADLCPCFHRSPTKLCPDLVSFMCWIATEFWSFAL